MREQAERFGTKCKFGEVTNVIFDSSPFTIELNEEEVIKSKTVIIATGATAKYLGIESEQRLIGRGVSACATCDGAFYRNVPVVLLEEVIPLGRGNFLTKFASKVTIIHRRDEFRASKIMADRGLKMKKLS